MDRSGMAGYLFVRRRCRCRYRLGRVTGPLEAVEDQGEAELVLVAEVVAGLKNMPECELGQVGIGVGGKLRQHDLRERRGLLWSVERQAPVLQREPVDVAVEGCIGVRGLLEGEAWRCGGIRGRRRGAAASLGRGTCGTPSGRSPTDAAPGQSGPRSPAGAWPSSSLPPQTAARSRRKPGRSCRREGPPYWRRGCTATSPRPPLPGRACASTASRCRSRRRRSPRRAGPGRGSGGCGALVGHRA